MSEKLSKILIAILLVAILTAGVFALAACGDNEDDSVKTVEIIIGEGESAQRHLYVTNRANLFDVLSDMSLQGIISGFNYTGSVTSVAKDAFVTSIGALSPAYGTTEYIAFFHTLDDITLRDMGEWALPDIQSDGKTFYYSGVGIQLLPAIDGESYLFVIRAY